MIERLVEQIEERFDELSRQMSDPEVIADRERYAEVGRAYRALEPAHALAIEYRKAADDAAGARELLSEDGDDADLREPASAFAAFARSARALEAWHRSGRRGPRPPGQVRPYHPPGLPATTKVWAGAAYRTIYDPDGRPPALRARGAF